MRRAGRTYNLLGLHKGHGRAAEGLELGHDRVQPTAASSGVRTRARRSAVAGGAGAGGLERLEGVGGGISSQEGGGARLILIVAVAHGARKRVARADGGVESRNDRALGPDAGVAAAGAARALATQRAGDAVAGERYALLADGSIMRARSESQATRETTHLGGCC